MDVFMIVGRYCECLIFEQSDMHFEAYSLCYAWWNFAGQKTLLLLINKISSLSIMDMDLLPLGIGQLHIIVQK